MKTNIKPVKFLLTLMSMAAVLPLALSSAHGAAVSLNFTAPGVATGGGSETINNYYNGGTDQYGYTGPNYGIAFSANAYALGQYATYPSGSNTGLEPGGGNALIFLSGSAATMDVAAGFTTGFSFYYSAPYDAGSINVWSGLDDTGTLLATLALPTTPTSPGEPYYGGGGWIPVGVTFAGTAESVDFGGTENYIAFADVTLNSGTPVVSGVPDGGTTLAMLGLALGGLAAVRRKLGMA